MDGVVGDVCDDFVDGYWCVVVEFDPDDEFAGVVVDADYGVCACSLGA